MQTMIEYVCTSDNTAVPNIAFCHLICGLRVKLLRAKPPNPTGQLRWELRRRYIKSHKIRIEISK